MSLYKDSNDNIHDDDNGRALHLLPPGCVEITQAEAEAIRVSQLPVIDPQVAINAEARAYLASTDWYVVRLSETGIAIPNAIKLLRQEARDSIV